MKDNLEIKKNVEETKKVDNSKARTHIGGKVFYGNSNEVTPVYFNSYNELSKNSKVKQEMEGFDSQYCDFVDYITRITHNIWEERGIGIIYDTYHDDVTMHCGSFNL